MSDQQMNEFSAAVLAWFALHGRKNLPWQSDTSSYRVWLSEVMLQQTRVDTVIPYFQHFIESFPAIVDLANASEDEVLSHWSGLGYYARARNLKKAAERVRDEYAGQFPAHFEDVLGLPGVGRSTAGAILSLAQGQRYAILDGNVKRVLGRCFMVEGPPAAAATLKSLWTLAETCTPQDHVASYNQAMMDIGATVCVRGTPNCNACPLEAICMAHRHGREREFPQPASKKILPVKRLNLLMLMDGEGRVLMEKRPPTGIWGGLWSLPECPENAEIQHWSSEQLGLEVSVVEMLAERRHTFSHYHLDYTPVQLLVTDHDDRVMDDGRRVWYKVGQTALGGVAAPVARLLAQQAERLNPQSQS